MTLETAFNAELDDNPGYNSTKKLELTTFITVIVVRRSRPKTVNLS